MKIPGRSEDSSSTLGARILALLILVAAVSLQSCQPKVVVSSANASPAELEELKAGQVAWHAERLSDLLNPNGFLSLISLSWLEEGSNTFGSSGDADLVVPDHEALKDLPGILGDLRLTGGTVALYALANVGSSDLLQIATDPEAAPEPLSSTTWSSEDSLEFYPTSTTLAVGPLRFFVIERGGNFGLRVRDLSSDPSDGFPGLDLWDYNPALRIQGTYEPYRELREIPFPNQTSLRYPQTSSGEVVVSVEGREFRLSVLGNSTTEPLFLVVGDETNGDGSYSGGRFVYSETPEADGLVWIDFNHLYNPPCVFSPWATCPLPPPQNDLPVRLEAGEKSVIGLKN